MSIGLWAKWPFYSYICDIDVRDRLCTVGRAPCTREALPNFRESSRVTRHSLVFRGLTSSQRTPRF